MFKNLNMLFIVAIISLSSLSATHALDLEEIDDNLGIEATTIVTESTGTVAEEITISNMEVIFNDTDLPADGKSETTIFIRVNDNNEDSLSESNINLAITIADNNTNEKGLIKSITFDKESELFNATYIAGKSAGEVSFKIEATSKADSSIKLEQLEDIILNAYTAPVIEVPATNEVENVDNILSSLDKSEAVEDEVIETNTNTNTNEEGINIVETKVVDENRLKITFDRTIFLPDDPLSLVKIIKSSDKTEVKISNITLSEDKLSLVVLTSDNIDKEPYLVTITEVIDGKTKKKISVINSELTVTGINELIILVLGLLAIGGIAYRRKTTIS